MKRITITEQQTGNYFTLNDNAQGSILREFEGFEYPDTKVSVDDVAGPYGSAFVNSKFGRRRFSIKGDLVSSSVFTLRRQLQKAIRLTGTMKLLQFTTYDDLELRCEAEVVKIVSPYTHKIHEFLIEFVAPDWRFYSEELVTQIMGISIVPGGASIPFPLIPVTIDPTVPTESEVNNIVINEGNEVTDPIFTIHGPGTDFILENVTADKTLTLNTTLLDTDTVVINVKNRTVIKNGTDNLYPSVTGDFWSLDPDENELRFFVTSGSLLGTTKLDIQFRHAYSGI